MSAVTDGLLTFDNWVVSCLPVRHSGIFVHNQFTSVVCRRTRPLIDALTGGQRRTDI
jgi:hypothetical protein